MSEVEDFLTKEEEREIVDAIVRAERHTSGEIRVHLEAHTDLPPMERAKEVFHILKMDNTKEANGVLLYIAVQDHAFTICGDAGINTIVGPDFWKTTRDTIAAHFKKGDFKNGIVAGIQEAAKVLNEHFPWNPGDTNELSNEISKA